MAATSATATAAAAPLFTPLRTQPYGKFCAAAVPTSTSPHAMNLTARFSTTSPGPARPRRRLSNPTARSVTRLSPSPASRPVTSMAAPPFTSQPSAATRLSRPISSLSRQSYRCRGCPTELAARPCTTPPKAGGLPRRSPRSWRRLRRVVYRRMPACATTPAERLCMRQWLYEMLTLSWGCWRLRALVVAPRRGRCAFRTIWA